MYNFTYELRTDGTAVPFAEEDVVTLGACGSAASQHRIPILKLTQ